jgi:hypothetical protein
MSDPFDLNRIRMRKPEKVTTIQPETGRSKHLKVPFVMVPVPWISDQSLFPARARLLLLLLYESRWGRREVHLTSAMGAKVGLSRWAKNRHARQLECDGLVRIERSGNAALVITMIIDCSGFRSDDPQLMHRKKTANAP